MLLAKRMQGARTGRAKQRELGPCLFCDDPSRRYLCLSIVSAVSLAQLFLNDPRVNAIIDMTGQSDD